jgi:hypothetical protein
MGGRIVLGFIGTMRKVAALVTIFWVKPNFFNSSASTLGFTLKTDEWVRMRTGIQLGSANLVRAWSTTRLLLSRTIREITTLMTVLWV